MDLMNMFSHTKHYTVKKIHELYNRFHEKLILQVLNNRKKEVEKVKSLAPT